MNDLEILNHHQLSNPTPVSLHFKTSETGAEEGRGGWGKVRKEKDLRRGSLFPSLPNPLPFSFLPCSLCPFDASHSGYFKIKRTKAHTTSQKAQTAGPIPISSAWRSIATPTWMRFQSIAYPFKQLCEERQSGVMFLVYGNNATGEA